MPPGDSDSDEGTSTNIVDFSHCYFYIFVRDVHKKASSLTPISERLGFFYLLSPSSFAILTLSLSIYSLKVLEGVTICSFCRSHCKRDLASERARKISASSCKLYAPIFKHSVSIAVSIDFVKLSAICAPEGTHLI